MISVEFNGDIISIADEENLQIFLEKHECHGDRFAVAINQCFVPRSLYHQVMIQEGDQIEVLTAMQGG